MVRALKANAIGCFLLLLVLVLAGCKRDKGVIYLIPEGYAGWLGVAYGVTGAPPLAAENGYSVVLFPNTGYLETCSTHVTGEGYEDLYFYYSGSSRRPVDLGRELGGGMTSQTEGQVGSGKSLSKFWVTRDAKIDFEKYVHNKPDMVGPFPGYSPPK
jgi:hypothetical protein